MSEKIRVVHIINSFEFGGAEAMLCNLLLRSNRKKYESTVVSLIDDMSVAEPIKRAGFSIDVVGMKPGIPDPRALMRLVGLLRRLRPDVIQTWMDHSNLLGGLAAKFAGGAPVVWGIHHANHVPGVAKRSTILTVNLCAKLSKWLPQRIVLCSEESRRRYAERGFAQDRLTVIPNGFNTKLFRPDPVVRSQVRQKIGVDDQTPLIGIAARFHRDKDHGTFVRAAAIVAKARPDVRFALAGVGIDGENAELQQMLASAGITEQCLLLGPRRDMPRFYAAVDVLTSSSISEAFPLALGEAMACGVPCVATDVGDSALILGTTGRVVPPSDPAAMAEAMLELVRAGREGRRRIGAFARDRVCRLFDLCTVTRQYESIYAELGGGEMPHMAQAPMVRGRWGVAADAPEAIDEDAHEAELAKV